MRPFIVQVERLVASDFTVEANSIEEAESIVEMWIADGEYGTVTNSTIENIETMPAENFGTECMVYDSGN